MASEVATLSQAEHQLTRLLEWYAAYRNDEWEHHHGIKLEEVELPGGAVGWSLIVDTKGTELGERASAKVRRERSESDWVQWHFEPGAFRAMGTQRTMNEAIVSFFAEIEHVAELYKRK